MNGATMLHRWWRLLSLPGPEAGSRGRYHCHLRLSRQLESSPWQQQEGGGGEEGHEVRERLERNIFRAGLRVLKGDRHALEKNLRERGVVLDLQKLLQLRREHQTVCQHIEALRQQRNINIQQHSTEGDANEEYVSRGKQLKQDITELEVYTVSCDNM
jgi:hypothetical protein